MTPETPQQPQGQDWTKTIATLAAILGPLALGMMHFPLMPKNGALTRTGKEPLDEAFAKIGLHNMLKAKGVLSSKYEGGHIPALEDLSPTLMKEIGQMPTLKHQDLVNLSDHPRTQKASGLENLFSLPPVMSDIRPPAEFAQDAPDYMRALSERLAGKQPATQEMQSLTEMLKNMELGPRQ